MSSIPLISSLEHPDGLCKQVWYADDASACGEMVSLREWFNELKMKGPLFGYFPEPSKCFLVVKEIFVCVAEKVFEGSGVNVVCSHRLLGGVIGSDSGKNQFVSEQVKQWASELECLAMIASVQPQVAFAAFTKSFQFHWSFVQRVTSNCQSWFAELEELIREKFLPNLLMGEFSEVERCLFSLPARWGGLGVCNPTDTGPMSYSLSRKATELIVEAIKEGCAFDSSLHQEHLLKTKKEGVALKKQVHEEKFECVIGKLDLLQRRSVIRAGTEKISAWLTVLPLSKNQFDLSPQEFRDALAIRYKRPLLNVADLCDGCGSVFSLSHALSCRKGGLVIRRHNEVRDAIGDLASQVWSKVQREPVVRDANYSNGDSALVADLGVRGVWIPQAEALFDVRVVDTDAPSYSNRTPKDVLQTAEREKKAKYSKACEERHALFTPFCCSVDGMLGGEADSFLNVIGERLSSKWDQGYGEVMGCIRARLSFAILRSTMLCLRGSRSKWRGLGIEDGAPIQSVMC